MYRHAHQSRSCFFLLLSKLLTKFAPAKKERKNPQKSVVAGCCRVPFFALFFFWVNTSLVK
jgi:hypothetical protein